MLSWPAFPVPLPLSPFSIHKSRHAMLFLSLHFVCVCVRAVSSLLLPLLPLCSLYGCWMECGWLTQLQYTHTHEETSKTSSLCVCLCVCVFVWEGDLSFAVLARVCRNIGMAWCLSLCYLICFVQVAGVYVLSYLALFKSVTLIVLYQNFSVTRARGSEARWFPGF